MAELKMHDEVRPEISDRETNNRFASLINFGLDVK